MRIGEKMGGSIVSRNIWEGKGRIKWCVRDEAKHRLDNGWRFLSEIDTDEYLHDSNNLMIFAWETICAIEPAIMQIIDFPIGTELTLIYDGPKRIFMGTYTDDVILVVDNTNF